MAGSKDFKKGVSMKLPILLYHDIRKNNFDVSSLKPGMRPYVLTESTFAAQMKWLSVNGYRTAELEDLRKSKYKSVILAFDDGWESNFDIAFPLLKHYGFQAIFFVTVNDIGRNEMMNWSHLRVLLDNGMKIGSHSLNHVVLTRLSKERLKKELEDSKYLLEKNLDTSIDYFSLPTGFYDRRVKRLAGKAGYKGICYSEVGYGAVRNNTDMAIFKKIGIKRSYSLETFKSIVEGEGRIISRLRRRQRIRNVAKKVMGAENYLRIREALLKNAL